MARSALFKCATACVVPRVALASVLSQRRVGALWRAAASLTRLAGVEVRELRTVEDVALTPRVLDGQEGSAQWLRELQPEVARVTEQLKRPPRLSVVLVGDRPDSHLYVSRKAETCHKVEFCASHFALEKVPQVGIEVVTRLLKATIRQEELERCVRQTCADTSVDAVLIQLPLPSHINEEAVTAALDPWKDVDGHHPLNMGHMLMRGHRPRFVPCTALGCMHLLKLNQIDVEKKTAVVVGDSNYVGIPLSVLLRNQNAAIVSVCHGISYKELFEDPESIQTTRVEAETCNPALPGPIDRWSLESMEAHDSQCPIERNVHLPSITRTADILIVAVGWPKLVKRDWVKPGAVVLDVGINVIPSRDPSRHRPQIAGDVDFEDVAPVASAISPVPGGVGPMTIAAVVHNTLQAAHYRRVTHPSALT